MMGDAVDRAALRKSLRQMNRGQLLKVAERAMKYAFTETLQVLIGNFLKVPFLHAAESLALSLLDEVQRFVAAALRGDFHESFQVNWTNSTPFSYGTDGFIAEFDRLISRCLGEAATTPTVVWQSLEGLFDLLRQIDADPDRILFFADEARTWQIRVDWLRVLAVYFEIVAAQASDTDFAMTVDGVIEEFCHYRRPELLAAAQSVANAAQIAAVKALPIETRRR